MYSGDIVLYNTVHELYVVPKAAAYNSIMLLLDIFVLVILWCWEIVMITEDTIKGEDGIMVSVDTLLMPEDSHLYRMRL